MLTVFKGTDISPKYVREADDQYPINIQSLNPRSFRLSAKNAIGVGGSWIFTTKPIKT